MTSPSLAPSAMTSTANRTKTRLAVTGRPSFADLVDGAFILALGLIALWGFRTTFDSPRFLVVGAVGLVLGIAVAHVANVLRQHWLVLALMIVVTFFLFGGAVALSSEAIAGFVPNGTVLGKLARLTVNGWKDLLTTLPPVDGSGQFLVLPYLLALAFGAATFLWARRVESPSWPVLLPVVLLGIVILMGTLQPAGLLVQGLGFAVVAFLWVVLRRRRGLRVVGTGAGMRSQAVIAAVVLAAAVGLGAVTGGHLPGTDGPRTVLRTYVEPPVFVSPLPSPLVGFRKYTEGAQKVWDQELFTVEGVKAGSLLRIAVLDDYSGTVWNAAGVSGGSVGTFRRVGQTIAPVDGMTDAKPQRSTLTVGAAYAGLSDASNWVPTMGYPTSMVFSGARAKELAASLVYNPATGQAIVTERLRAGDKVTVEAAPVSVAPKTLAVASGSGVSSEATQVVAAKAVKWAEKKPTPWDQLQAVAGTLKNGAYSDGTKTGETQYLPGHGVARTTTFLTRQQIVGNDEQYASTYALMANSLGVPARVVMGAVVPDGGSVRGEDVHAWVELRGADGRWYAVPNATFMPDRDKTPQQQPRATAKDSNSADVPPPNSQRPPGSVDATYATTSAKVRPPTVLERLAAMPAWVWLLIKVIGYPLLVLGFIVTVLALARAVRRRRRQGTGAPSRRMAQGWRDLVDHARDLGIKVPAGLTRMEQADIVGHQGLARAADRAVFGYGEPESGVVQAYWDNCKKAKSEVRRGVTRRRRLGRLFSVRGLLFKDDRPVEKLPKVAQTRRISGKRAPVLRRARA
ncbi:MAG TPA: transglutaminase domain-containing protein [Phycicoccus sp.]|nr:transglutaminase domain-containing protein [Phycicoccus sp.]